MTVEKAQRILDMFCFFHLLAFFMWDACVCLKRGGRGGTSLSHMMVSKKLDFTLTYFLCILHSLTAGWCAIFTHSNRSESSGDISAVEIGVSRIHNTIMPRTHWFFFNALRMLLTWRETEELMARVLVHIQKFEIVPVRLCQLITGCTVAYIDIYCCMTVKQPIITRKIDYIVATYSLHTYH